MMNGRSRKWVRVLYTAIVGEILAVGFALTIGISQDVEASPRGASSFNFEVERIYAFDDDSWTADPSVNFGKSRSEFRWSPFDEEYGAGYVDIGNGNVERTCSVDVPGETSTAVRNGVYCEFPGGQNSKNEHNYFDTQSGGHKAGELYDTRVYVWSMKGSCRPRVKGVGGPEDVGSGRQHRFPGSLARSCLGATIVEFHFYESGTLYTIGEDGRAYHKSTSELTAGYLASKEREFKGILRGDDIDGPDGFEGYTPLQGVEQVWVTKNTDLRVSIYGNAYRDLLPAPCTGSTTLLCRRWRGTEDHSSGTSYADNNAAIWMEFDGTPEKPFTIIYTTSGHGSSITSELAVVNYVLEVEPEDGFYPSLDPLFEQAEEENRITHYDTAPYYVYRYWSNNVRTIRRFGVTRYSWFNPDYSPASLPDGCMIDGWYDNPELLGEKIQNSSKLLTDGNGNKRMILRNSENDPGFQKNLTIDSNTNETHFSPTGAYYFYGVATCDPVHIVDEDTECNSGDEP